VRAPVLFVLLAACSGGKAFSNTRPSAMPMLSELPTDAEKRDGILNQSNERARPENRRSLTKKQQKAETAAAVAAALLGQAFSKTQNVTLGVAGDFDENALFQRQPEQPKKKATPPPEKTVPATELVPWIKLEPDAQKSKPADSENVR